ncbi:MAG: MFS transporter [Muribaculaceae bacterium]|nr:MFS transporter [Muribaculaceae bacterium]
MVKDVFVDNQTLSSPLVVINGNDTIVKDGKIALNDEGEPKVSFNTSLSGVKTIKIADKVINAPVDVQIRDYLNGLKGEQQFVTASIVSTGNDGKLSVEDANTVKVEDASRCKFVKKTVLNAASPRYNEAGNWVGLLYAVQALASVVWALILPKLGNYKFSYSLSLLLGAAGFILVAFLTSPYLLFIGFILIGCAWSAMLAWPFTLLTNSLHGGNIGAYLGLFNCTICLPQIIAALAGGWILSLMSTPGKLAPEYLMMMIAGISIALGAVSVFFIKASSAKEVPTENIPESDIL